MTDRIKGVIVTLDQDYREDDVEKIVSAIYQIKGVRSVKSLVSNLEQHIAEERVRHEIGQKLMAVLYPPTK